MSRCRINWRFLSSETFIYGIVIATMYLTPVCYIKWFQITVNSFNSNTSVNKTKVVQCPINANEIGLSSATKCRGSKCQTDNFISCPSASDSYDKVYCCSTKTFNQNWIVECCDARTYGAINYTMKNVLSVYVVIVISIVGCACAPCCPCFRYIRRWRRRRKGLLTEIDIKEYAIDDQQQQQQCLQPIHEQPQFTENIHAISL